MPNLQNNSLLRLVWFGILYLDVLLPDTIPTTQTRELYGRERPPRLQRETDKISGSRSAFHTHDGRAHG